MLGQSHQSPFRRCIRTGIGIFMAASLCTGCAGTVREQAKQKPSRDSTALSIYQADPSVSASAWRGTGAQQLLSDTNLRLQYVSTKGSSDELLLRMVSGTIPDLIVFPTGEDAQRYLDAGLLVSLDAYDESLPSVFQDADYADARTWIRKTIGTGHAGKKTGAADTVEGADSSLYVLPLSVGETEGELRAAPMVLTTAWTRAHCPVPETLEDYLDLIEQMRRAQPTNPVGESMYGICLWQEDKEAWTHLSSLAALYGIDMQTVSSLMEVNQQTGQIRSMLSEDSFSRRAMHFYFEANQRGLLDPDSSSQTYGNAVRKAQENRIYLTANLALAENGTYTRLAADDMLLYCEPDHTVGVHQYIGIHKNTKHLEEALTFLNWLYNEETIRQLYSGETASAAWPVSRLPKTEMSVTGEPSDGEETETLTKIAERQKIHAMEAVYYVEVEPASIQEKTSAIAQLVYNAFWDLIYAEDETAFEARWQQLVKEADAAGMEQVTDFYAQAWETARENAQSSAAAKPAE